MNKVCFLNGHLILREHKTGVHFFHEILTRKITEFNPSFEVSIAFFDRRGQHKKIMKKDSNQWINKYANICTKWSRIFSYLLPIEIFFGKNDVYFCDGLFPITIFKSKKICLVHDLMVKIYPDNYSLVRKAYLNWYFRKLPNADLIISVSENTKRDIVKYYGVSEDKIVVCNNGADDLPNPSPSVLENDDIDLTRKYIFYLGDMRLNKNLINTVKGFFVFCSENNTEDLYFYIAGKKNGEYEKILNIVQSSPYGKQVIFLGYVGDNDKYLLYENAMAVILISYYEGFGMPIIEAMQHYKPVITSDCSSMKEVGADAAILVRPNAIDEIAFAIDEVYNGKYVVDRKAYQMKLDKYSFDNVAQTVRNAIEEIIQN